MSKDYLAQSKPQSPFSEKLLAEFKAKGGKITRCAHGESGGEVGVLKDMANKSVKKKH